jgi:hypothetical protein
MSYDCGLTASGFYAGVIDYPDEEAESAQNQKNREELEQRKLEHLIHLTKLTAKSISPEDLVENCIKIISNKLLDSAIKKYCYMEKIPQSLAFSTWDLTNLLCIVQQYIDALDASFQIEDKSRLRILVKSILINEMSDSVYERVGYMRSFINKLNCKKALDKELMRQLLSICRLFINILDINSRDIHYIKNQINKNKFLIEKEMESSLPSYRGKKFIKNWKVRHLRDIIEYAPLSGQSAYNELLGLDITKGVIDLRKEASDIIFINLPLK